MPEDRPVGFVVPETKKDAPSSADGMIVAGTLVAAVAIGGLTGFLWALLFIGVALIVAGVIRAAAE